MKAKGKLKRKYPNPPIINATPQRFKRTRVFDGKRYRFKKGYFTFKEAMAAKRWYEERGHKTRVIEHKNHFARRGEIPNMIGRFHLFIRG